MADREELDDPYLPVARRAWDTVTHGAGRSSEIATKICADLSANRAHPAFRWAALTLGRLAAISNRTQEAESHLTEGVGSFAYQRDTYGRALAEAHFAIPTICRQDLDAAHAFCQIAWGSSVNFLNHDADLLHGISASMCWYRDELHPALMHCVQSLEITDRTSDAERRVSLMINICSLLVEMGQLRLAASVSDESVRLADLLVTPSPHHLGSIVNNVHAHTFAGNLKAADQAAQRAQELIASGKSGDWMCHRTLCLHYAIRAHPDEARRHLALQRESTDINVNSMCRVPLMLSEAEVLEAQGDYHGAIDIAKRVLDLSVNVVSRGGYRVAAHCLSRSYSALGRSAESTRWKKFTQSHAPSSPLDAVFASQIGSHLKREAANPLTAQETECLTLSARGQTSSDSALKLGLKPRTVNFHIAKVPRKLNAVNRHEAIAKATTANFLSI